MNTKHQDQSDNVSARRRLIRGLFAAPAALTVCSGSAFAQASSTLGCVAQQLNQPALNVGGSAAYVRVPLYKNGTHYYVRQADLEMVRGSASSFFDSNSKWGWNVDNLGQPAASDLPSGNTRTTGNYVALRVEQGVNNSVYIVGFDTNTSTTGSAIATSCWTSFAGVQSFF